MIAQILEYMSYPFVRNAMIVGVLIALCSSLIGVTLVLRRFSLLGDGLSHVAFGASTVASVLLLSNEMLVTLPVTIFFSILLFATGERAKIRGDAAIAMLSVSSLAFGYLIMNVFSSTGNVSGDVCSVLFGSTSILTLTKTEVIASICLAILVVAVFVLLYHRIFAVTYDESFSQAIGGKAWAVNFLLAMIIAVVIVLSINLVGSLLISALVVFPALSAMRICRTYLGVTIFSAILSVICASLGIVVSIIAGTPVGSTIVAADTVVFLVCAVLGFIFRRCGK